MVKRMAQAKHCASKATRVRRIELQQSYVAKEHTKNSNETTSEISQQILVKKITK